MSVGTPGSAADWELANLCDVGAALAASALAREESRGAHTRTDFPDRDDPRFQHRLVHRRPRPNVLRDRSETDRISGKLQLARRVRAELSPGTIENRSISQNIRLGGNGVGGQAVKS